MFEKAVAPVARVATCWAYPMLSTASFQVAQRLGLLSCLCHPQCSTHQVFGEPLVGRNRYAPCPRIASYHLR